ncbi:RNA polymerase subunit sigma-24 [Brevundimonas sp. LM2]|nr:RNA polymerase subunit sigma-24 [Brevundimonas sp. LM2]
MRRDAFLDGLARRYSQPLARFFARRVANKADVPDLVQDVFIGLSRMKDPTQIERPETFLFVAAANALRDRNRREITRRAGAHDEFDDQFNFGSGFSPERVLEARDALVRIRESLSDLPVRTRDAFVLRAFEELTMAEVASALGVSVRAAEKHYARALVHVAAALEGPSHPIRD